MSPNGFEFEFTDVDGSTIHFNVDGISDEAADGILTGLAAVTDVAAVKVTELREDITP
jgi:hypothetical protein